MSEKTCCLISPSDPSPNRGFQPRLHLKKAVLAAIDEGYTVFMSNFEHGNSIIFASVVAELKASGQALILKAAIACKAQIHETDLDLLETCDDIHLCSRQMTDESLMIRDRYMVDASDLIFYAHRKGADPFDLSIFQYAQAHDKPIRTLAI